MSHYTEIYELEAVVTTHDLLALENAADISHFPESV